MMCILWKKTVILITLLYTYIYIYIYIRERTIIGSNRILGVSYRILSTSIVSADIMCVTADSAAVNTGHITQEIKGHSRQVARRAAASMIRERVGGAAEGRL